MTSRAARDVLHDVQIPRGGTVEVDLEPHPAGRFEYDHDGLTLTLRPELIERRQLYVPIAKQKRARVERCLERLLEEERPIIAVDFPERFAPAKTVSAPSSISVRERNTRTRSRTSLEMPGTVLDAIARTAPQAGSLHHRRGVSRRHTMCRDRHRTCLPDTCPAAGG